MSKPPTSDYAHEETCALGPVANAPVATGTALTESACVAGQSNNNALALASFCRDDLARDDLTGLILGPYALGKRLGRGGMGTVYRATHTGLDRQIAIKFVAPGALSHPDAAARFRQESLALGRLKHDHIVDAVDAGTVDGVPYLVTEYVVGEDLSHHVARRGPLPINEACAVIHQAALGLAFAHQNGFLHRDVKPSNLLIDQSARVKLIDFGLVRSAKQDNGLTTAGQMLGTCDYIAPEQSNDAANATPASDIYSLGCTLMFLLSGSPPFASGKYRSSMAKLKGHLVDRSPVLDELKGRIPPQLCALLEQMLAKSPAERPADMNAVAAALALFANKTAIADGSRRRSDTWLRAGTLVAASLAGALCLGGFASPNWPAAQEILESTPPTAHTNDSLVATPEEDLGPNSVPSSPTPASPDFFTTDNKQTANAVGVQLSLQSSLDARRSETTAVKSTRSP